jgi:hypothetical protein
MDYVREAIEALKDYNNLITAEKNLVDQINGLMMERDNIKATRIKDVVVNGGNSQPDDAIANNIFKRKVLNLNLHATRKKIECMDRAFARLDDIEGKVLNRLFIIGGKNGIDDLCKELGYERSQVYNIRNDAIRRLSKALFGVGVQ